jgi:hypothetical protein
MSALVSELSGDIVRVSLGARPAGLQDLRLFDWGESKEVAELFFAALWQVFGEVPEPQPESGRPKQTAVSLDELERLALLHERGALDDDEFRRAKQRLLAE